VLPLAQIRIGKTLEDLDALAGSIAFQHCRGAGGSALPPSVSLVTASVDRIVVRREFGTSVRLISCTYVFV
jgi:acyl-coenzyme A thioesterase 9